MIRATTITLLGEAPHGVFEANTPSKTEVFAEVKSVKMSEFYTALNDGIQPEYIFTLTDYADYNGQKTIIYGGTYYDVVRTYTPVNGQTIDITVKRKEING